LDYVIDYFRKSIISIRTYFLYLYVQRRIMDTKLTLKLDKIVIEKAKSYAAEKKISLSKLIESYLQSITADKKHSKIEISPFVKSMRSGVQLPSDLDYKTEYSDHLMKKYK